jgi:hypothetical protein
MDTVAHGSQKPDFNRIFMLQRTTVDYLLANNGLVFVTQAPKIARRCTAA